MYNEPYSTGPWVNSLGFILHKGDYFVTSCCCRGEQALWKWGLLLKKRICSLGSYSYSLKIKPLLKRLRREENYKWQSYSVFQIKKIWNHFPYYSRARGYKTYFMLNSVEHEILNAHKYKSIKKFSFFRFG